MVYTDDNGFTLDFTSQFDLTAMTSVRMLIRRPSNSVAAYDFALAEFNTVNVGGVLSYLVRPGDLTVDGDYLFQVIAKDANSDVAFKPYTLKVERRIAGNGWNI
ncbi:MAG: hypothetical protein JKY34_12565 [Kordiimonadaceae bacterium]|nr:hypothetical protein [Kordiimonadaceae bacterium]PCJ37778.1 MAG: hypothetical protein COA75_03385 [Cellvibrionales bacterium]